MWYFYVLESTKDFTLYNGVTDDIARRVHEHNRGAGGQYTRKHKPYTLIFYEAYTEKLDALRAEKFFKSGYGRQILKEDKLQSYFKKKNKP